MSIPTREFIVLIPEHPSTGATRTSVRPTHLQNVKPLFHNGTMRLGGATLDAVAAPTKLTGVTAVSDGGQEPTGTIVVVRAASKEAILGILKDDVYAEAGVWDLERAVM